MPDMVTRIHQTRPYTLYIEEWIEAKGLTKKQVADRLDCSPGTISKLISGQMKRTTQWLAAIAWALGDDVEVPDLFYHPDRPRQQDLLRDVPDTERDRIVKAIKALTGTDG